MKILDDFTTKLINAGYVGQQSAGQRDKEAKPDCMARIIINVKCSGGVPVMTKLQNEMTNQGGAQDVRCALRWPSN